MRSSNTDPTDQPAHQLAAEIAARRLSPVGIVEAFLARIARLDGKLHAYIDVYGDDARLAAEAADKAIRSGHSVGPLHGVPIALKDLIDLEGRVTTGGSEVWRDRRSTVTATLARRLIAAGMIVLGKTHTVEFAMGGWGTNEHLGTPWNPWDLGTARTPGGSSSGTGVAVASGMAPWGIGTDTGGSVRLPASWCGLPGVKGLRLARMPQGERDGCTPEVLAAYDAALDALGRLGAEIVDLALPCRFADATRAVGRIIASEAYQLVGKLVDDPALPIDSAVRPRIQPGGRITAPDYLAALAERDAMKRAFLGAFQEVDALLTPTTQTPAIPV